MKTYVLKRLLLMVPTLLAITLVSFAFVQIAPGDPAKLAVKKAEQAEGVKEGALSQEVIEQARRLYGLDKPLPERYAIWLWGIVRGEFGYSYKDNRPVWDKILEALPITLQLNVLSLLAVYAIAIPVGVFSAVRRNTAVDDVLTTALFVLFSLPSFWAAMMLLKYLAGGEGLDLFPVYGVASPNAEALPPLARLWDRLEHLFLPVVCLSYGGIAGLSRFQRSGVLETLSQEYVAVARAKGLPESRVIFKHVLRNSLIPMVTLAAGLLPELIGGSVIIESVFSLPGMGKLGFEAVLSRDYPVIMALLTMSAFLTLVGILLADLLYVVVDPRISLE